MTKKIAGKGLFLAIIVFSVIIIFHSTINNKEGVSIENLSASGPLSNEYANDYMGLSLLYPEPVEARSIGVAYRSLSENVEFDFNGTACFQIEVVYESFNKDNHSEYSLNGYDDVEQDEPFLGIKNVNALPAPIPYTIEDIQKITINSTIYYTYSFRHASQKGIRRDVLIYPRGRYYYKFTFLNQDSEFIMRVMESVNYINSTGLDFSKPP